jgi:hypothetical protein
MKKPVKKLSDKVPKNDFLQPIAHPKNRAENRPPNLVEFKSFVWLEAILWFKKV